MKGIGKPKAYGSKTRKDRDEDLLLFREMFKREKERTISLLQPVSDEFEPAQGSYPLYKIPSGKRGAGNDFLANENEKNDYDWLKTPPATPLFPSLEMEANDPIMVFHKELPILHNLKPSRFSGKLEEAKLGLRPKSPSSRSTASSQSDSSSRSETPNTRPTSSSGKMTTQLRGILNLTERPNKSVLNSNSRSNTRAITPRAATTKESSSNSSTPRKQNTDMKPRSRGVSPMVRLRIPAIMPGFSDESTTTNLKTSVTVIPGRTSSATRGRPENSTPGAVEPKVEGGKPRRQSCSPSVTRGRRVESGEQNSSAKAKVDNSLRNGTLVMGSRMVDKMMNARRSVTGDQEKGLRAKNQNPAGEGSGFGRLMSRTSLDIALKHMEISKNASNTKCSSHPDSALNSKPSSQTTPGYDVRNVRGRASSESKSLVKKGESKIGCQLY